MASCFGTLSLSARSSPADVLAGYLAVLAGTSSSSICFDSFPAASASGCHETGRYMDWGPTQGVVFALIALSLVFLGAYLVNGTRRWLVATLVITIGFVAVPAAAAMPAVFNDSGSVQLPLFSEL
jgi:hypothetical protein